MIRTVQTINIWELCSLEKMSLYEIKFDFAHKQFNGKYLCIKAVDKVGNSSFKASSDKLNVNIAPEVD